MACNSCSKPFTLFRKEKGCPNCGFSYCSKCLHNKMYVDKLKSEAKVCTKCEHSTPSQLNKINNVRPPDAYFKRIGNVNYSPNDDKGFTISKEECTKDQEILQRLRKLKEDSKTTTTLASEKEIAQRLNKIKGEIPTASEAELHERLNKLRGISSDTVNKKTILSMPNPKTEQEQVEDLMKQYLEQTKIDAKYKDEFDNLVNDIESRLQNLKGSTAGASSDVSVTKEVESEDEEETVRKILQKIKSESSSESEINATAKDELPFCEICNEDANMRCLGCQYLFCKRCFLEHKDEDDGCDRYEPYKPLKNV